jgi:protein-S-isoprenylcysteine O-methyltransferase Ste14
MTDETVFRIVLGVLVAAMYVPRKLYEQRMRVVSAHGLDRDEDRRPTLAWQSLLLGISLWATIITLAKPAWTNWASFPLPNWLRWLGAGLAVVGTALLLGTHRALGDNFFGGLKVRRGHELVTHGPYRWVQHPMYVAFFVLGVGYLLLSANWLIGLPWLVGTVLVSAYRLRREESMMRERFGEEYQAYQRRTGRFLPRLRARGYLSWPDGSAR